MSLIRSWNRTCRHIVGRVPCRLTMTGTPTRTSIPDTWNPSFTTDVSLSSAVPSITSTWRHWHTVSRWSLVRWLTTASSETTGRRVRHQWHRDARPNGNDALIEQTEVGTVTSNNSIQLGYTADQLIRSYRHTVSWPRGHANSGQCDRPDSCAVTQNNLQHNE